MMRMSDRDTIVAIATAPGEGAIGIVRLSGPQAILIASNCFKARNSLQNVQPRQMILGRFVHTGQILDEVLACVMPGPHSYTGDDTVELNCHGGPLLLRRVVEALVENGARIALPGEFTKRAFLNGKLDLSQAEAVADMISASSDISLKTAFFQLRGGLSTHFEGLAEKLRQGAMLLEAGLDFSEDVHIDLDQVRVVLQRCRVQIEDLILSYRQGKVVREGGIVALVGRPNVGKSSLMNRLLEEDRSIVTDIPGTTRDTIEESIDLEGVRATLIDTAGLRETADPVEREGTRRSQQSMSRATVVLYLVDGSEMPVQADQDAIGNLPPDRAILIANKSDLGIKTEWKNRTELTCYPISALTGEGVTKLRRAVRDVLVGTQEISTEVITHERHVLALTRAQEGLSHALDSLEMSNPGELIALDIRVALDALADIVGETSSDDILDQIFKTFCIGK